jgi:hypothetical protein
MDIVVRKVFMHGKSLTFTLPKVWEIPEILNVYSNGIYFVYSQLSTLEGMLKARKIGQVRRRTARSRKYTYYLLTIPRRLAYELKIRPGATLIILRVQDFDAPTFIGVVREKPVIQFIKSLVTGELELIGSR